METVQKYLDALVARLPAKVQPFAKALVPTAVAAVAAAADLAVSGVELRQIALVAGGGVTSILTYLVRNVK